MPSMGRSGTPADGGCESEVEELLCERQRGVLRARDALLSVKRLGVAA
jgi:hypothetical protein